MTVAEGAPGVSDGITDGMLQWGRNLTVAEGALERQVAMLGRAASMGPQLDSCGREKCRALGSGVIESFNGAAT